jgi:hypothetical protein
MASIVSLAERPDGARGAYEVALEAVPDIPGGEAERVEPFDDWLLHEMMGPGDRLREVLVLRGSTDVGTSRADGGQARIGAVAVSRGR